jgi:UDP-N-acetyl-D-mannosaminuronate dehydrogenase
MSRPAVSTTGGLPLACTFAEGGFPVLGFDADHASDATLVVTDHSTFDPAFIVRHSRLVVDTRNLTRGVGGGAGRIVRA